MKNNVSKKLFIRSCICFFIAIVFFIIYSNYLIKGSYAARIPTLKVCVWVDGSPLPSSAEGVVRFRDILYGCGGGNTRYLEIRKTEVPSGDHVNFVNNSSNCANFAPWGRPCPNSLRDNQRWWLYNSWINVPGVGSQRRSPEGFAASFGCVECRPGYFGAFVDGYTCDLCNQKRFSNNCGTVQVNINCTPNTPPPNHPPELDYLDYPWDCYEEDSYTFVIQGVDEDGGDDIRQMRLDVGGNIFTINIVGSQAYLSGGGSLTRFYQGNTEARAEIRVSNLQSLTGEVRVRGWVQDQDWENSGWVSWEWDTFYIYHGSGPSLSVSSDGNVVEDKIEVEWHVDNISLPIHHGNIECFEKGMTGWSWESWSPYTSLCVCDEFVIPDDQPSAGGSITCDWVGGLEEDFEVGFLIVDYCKEPFVIEDLDIITADPWLMTAFGDTYSYLGYSDGMEMLGISDSLRNRIGIGYGNLAYFSHYIISKSTGPWFPGRNSLREYFLSDYTDMNREKIGSSNRVYDYIKEIAGSNGCGSEVATLPPSCSGMNVYFLNKAGTTTLPLGWLNQPRNSNRACVIVSNGSIQVPAGASDPDQIDAFFLVDGEFSTALDREILIINGGVIANTVRFNRDLYGNNLNDPAELIRYDPKYLDLLRDCLGENYPYKVREYRYSVPD